MGGARHCFLGKMLPYFCNLLHIRPICQGPRSLAITSPATKIVRDRFPIREPRKTRANSCDATLAFL
jgi:hypothetical protein